ncbi:MAG: hormogonium polysaccharide biosynthesis protein HpsA [Chroococcus sp. CMT-3BRIN-NPC107]|nr:hormogonium polysaccharide biosynthesis protein HpsA [Chroococcus sp. CMT-3BRIN-NPC107]
MSTNKQDKAKQNLLKQIKQPSKKTAPKHQIQWLLRSLLVRGSSNFEAGFVLPTVAMVSLVVVLLSVALVVRAFDRSKNASNVRVNQVVLNAATPAVDRAKAKLKALLSDPTLPRDTPSDIALYNAINSSRYTFGDETQLKLVKDINGNGTIEKQPDSSRYVLENDETLSTAWKFPVDTDNNGKFDSYTLYSITFRSPSRGTDGKFNRVRNPLEARTPPMKGALSRQCENTAGTSSSLVGESSWYKSGSKLTKSFFAYTATVPITASPGEGYEVYAGNKGFTALEYQQDQSRVPLNNNAALFQDDLELSPGPAFRMNGKIFTNANLLIGGHGGAIRLYQVSSKNSCFYKEENSKINVGGNVGTGNIADTTDQTAVTIDLFKGLGNAPGTATIDGSNRSTTFSGGNKVGYNDAAYTARIALMKQKALTFSTTNPPTVTSVNSVAEYPAAVKDGFRAKVTALGGNSLNPQDVLADQIEIYLKDRTRRVPFAEIGFGANALSSYTSANIFTSGIAIDPPAVWREPTTANTGLTLNTDNLKQTQPEKQQEEGIETYLGDRINVGNNLPAIWKNGTSYITDPLEKLFLGSTIKWTAPSDKPRYRTTQVVALPDIGISDRNGFWEDAAAQQPANNLSNTGGLRVITGAGIYHNLASTNTVLSATSFLRATPTTLDNGTSIPIAPLLAGDTTATAIPYTLIWPDTMPMSGGADDPITTGVNESIAPPHLRMRATAVYHYVSSAGTSQTPIACVSSYYDPTNATTAKNKINFDGGYGTDTTNGRSNNGVVYLTPYSSNTDRVTAIATNLAELKAQAKLMFPNGRIVNEPLQKALVKLNGSGGLLDSNKPLSLSENSAIDTAICSIKILDTTLSPSTSPVFPHGAIREATFLNAREIKAIDKTASNYDLELEQRQPLEIRVTDINLDSDPAKGITKKTIGTNEYVLPNSGIIYASRDDGLLDLSDTSAEKELISPTDFKLDPTRRPNSIRLINGSNLERDDDYRAEEKGLTLVTNLPAYIRGNFNLHEQSGTSTDPTEEFTDTLENDWSDFYSRNTTLNTNFACRKGQTGCGSNGDQWRAATIISDAMVLLSGSFRDGFRNQGDYDLNNNAGTSVTQARKKNGFWDNSFVPSALWWNTSNTDNAYPDEKTTDSYLSSYLTNTITPVQRRVDFPEYLMEYCPKIPVSLCTPSDWVINTLNLKATGAINLPFVPTIHQAGTTATAPSSNVERYARRLAFKRKSDNTLELTDVNGEATPIPLGINSLGVIKEFPYSTDATATLPRTADNALWYQTTTNRAGKPNLNTTFETDQPLSYTGETKLVSPPTPDILGVPSLNLPESNPASGYTICTKNDGATSSPSVKSSSTLGLSCNSGANNAYDAAQATLTGLLALNPTTSTTDNIVVPTRTGTTGAFPAAAGTTTVFTSNPSAPTQPVVNVIDVGGDFAVNTGDTIIKLVGNENSIFVFRSSGSSLDFGDSNGCSTCRGVKLVREGVEANNIFWAANSNMKWNTVSSTFPHTLAGTFINKGTGSPKWNNLIIEGGRILDVNGIPSSSNFSSDTRIYAIASNGQPLLVPVLQIHSPEGTPSNSSTDLPTDGNLDGQWLQRVTADNVTINAVFVSGNSPSRPEEGDLAGLHNFVRFIERWADKPLNIKGSFMQLSRSAYATAPFTNVLAAKQSANDGTLSIFGYSSTSYKGNSRGYYTPPTRQWGFDVGLLSQSPDLFAQKFTLPPTTPPDEFFRQVGQDDAWVNNLLCAAEKLPPATAYTAAINQRPNNCLAISLYQ